MNYEQKDRKNHQKLQVISQVYYFSVHYINTKNKVRLTFKKQFNYNLTFIMKTQLQLEQQTSTKSQQDQDRKQKDAFDKLIDKHQKSKTDQILNLIYSLLAGVLSGVLTRKHLKYGKTIGLVIAMSSYIISKKMSKISMD